MPFSNLVDLCAVVPRLRGLQQRVSSVERIVIENSLSKFMTEVLVDLIRFYQGYLSSFTLPYSVTGIEDDNSLTALWELERVVVGLSSRKGFLICESLGADHYTPSEAAQSRILSQVSKELPPDVCLLLWGEVLDFEFSVDAHKLCTNSAFMEINAALVGDGKELFLPEWLAEGLSFEEMVRQYVGTALCQLLTLDRPLV